jgi:hypothetical protein
MNDLEKSFRQFVDGVFPRYRGIILERKDGGFVAMGTWYPNMEQVDKAIDAHILALNLSINRIKTQQ